MRLTVEGLAAGYGATVALSDVSIVVPEGSVVALLGPNGAGKTTLLSAISGLLPPRAGRVTLGADDVTGSSTDEMTRRGVCHITEGRSVFPGLTVRDNLVMFSARGAKDECIERAVDAFPRLGERLDQIAGTMSGGEQQMLALARAYGRRAEVVLLDEVSLGLAPIIVDAIFAFLRQLADEGISLLLVEQYVARALGLADFVYMLSRGRIAFAGEPHEVHDNDLAERYLGAGVH